MEENQENVEVKNDNTSINENTEAGTQASQNKDEGNSERVYTQEEYNALDKKLKAKYEKKLKEFDIEGYNKWVESQNKDEQKRNEKETEYQKTKTELEETKKYIAVLESGVNKDDSDYVLFKVSKMDGDFEENLEEFLKSNPKFKSNHKEDEKKADTTTDGVSVNSSNNKTVSGVDAILKSRHPDLFK